MQDLHRAGLVHRDVKPANIIFSESARKFKLIDLGACADLRSGTNYIPDESILDPMYCPPEQVPSAAGACLPLPCSTATLLRCCAVQQSGHAQALMTTWSRRAAAGMQCSPWR